MTTTKRDACPTCGSEFRDVLGWRWRSGGITGSWRFTYQPIAPEVDGCPDAWHATTKRDDRTERCTRDCANTDCEGRCFDPAHQRELYGDDDSGEPAPLARGSADTASTVCARRAGSPDTTKRDACTDEELERRCLCVSCRGGVPDKYLWSVVRVYSECNGFDDCAGCPLFTRSVSAAAGCRAHYDTALDELTTRLAESRAEVAALREAAAAVVAMGMPCHMPSGYERRGEDAWNALRAALTPKEA